MRKKKPKCIYNNVFRSYWGPFLNRKLLFFQVKSERKKKAFLIAN